jgi:hypothetical protein
MRARDLGAIGAANFSSCCSWAYPQQGARCCIFGTVGGCGGPLSKPLLDIRPDAPSYDAQQTAYRGDGKLPP